MDMQKVAGGYGLVEAPVWREDGLLFSDVLNGGVWRLGADGDVSQVVPKRRGVGGMALHANGGLIVGGRNIAWVGPDGETRVLLTPDVIPGAIGFNDLTTDAIGRIYVGSLAYRVFADPPKPGFLHVIDLDGSMRTLSDGVMLTNGLGFSPDGKRLYHSDAGGDLVRVYDVMDDGSVSPWRPFASLGERHVPDGLKVAADGSVWVADARGGRVAVFEPDGSHRMDVAAPLPMVTSLCFGGDDLKDLYVVTGSEGGPEPNCGSVFRTRAEVAGLALPPARVAV
ncbi:MAG TPA: SMP-30/gluconolactonase/LRE family protein [Caulobacteraceae bacterium]|jgi:gluconolactonase|nr:SMP-30/gluconolactonase/LRE family protein [Caulobacteraceae bacterium]